MYSVYFENQNNIIRPIGAGYDFNICMAIIDEFLKEHKFKSYYKNFYNVTLNQYHHKGEYTRIDVGSHVEFFYIKPPIDIKITGDKT
jgi:hypothetical protein